MRNKTTIRVTHTRKISAFPRLYFSFNFLHLRPKPRDSAVPERPRTSATLEMALFRRQAAKPNIYDDQHPDLWGLFEGNWYRYHNMTEYHNGTSTATSTTGASLTFTFTGTSVVEL